MYIRGKYHSPTSGLFVKLAATIVVCWDHDQGAPMVLRVCRRSCIVTRPGIYRDPVDILLMVSPLGYQNTIKKVKFP